MKERDLSVIGWKEGKVWFLDQTRLPGEEHIVQTDDPAVVASAIRSLGIRGAPLIGIAVAYGFALAFQRQGTESRSSQIARIHTLFASTRPTAVNLFWALDRMKQCAESFSGSVDSLAGVLVNEAKAIHEEDRLMCEQIGRHGSELLAPGASVLTHCNTGSLATGGIGTALGVVRMAWERKTLRHVYIDETRPLFQGARLTAWELSRLGIPSTLIADSTAAFLMLQGRIHAVVVGADRIAANGDVANKIGTYGLAVSARHHGIPFYVAAPSTTVDLESPSGMEIPVEVRGPEELVRQGGRRLAPEGMEVYAPAFDVTPCDLVTAIVTEKGILRPPYVRVLAGLRHRTEGVQA